MAQTEVILPKMGESVAEATITTWLKKVGEMVEAEEPIVEIATDKVDSEVPAPQAGKIIKLLVEEGEVAQVGQAIAVIAGEGDDDSVAPDPSSRSNPEEAEAVEAVQQTVVEAKAAALVRSMQCLPLWRCFLPRGCKNDRCWSNPFLRY